MIYECTGCERSLNDTEFHDVKKWRRCKVCVRSAMSKRYTEDAGVQKQVKTRNRLKLLARYGLTWESFIEMLRSQGDACAICGTGLGSSVGLPRDKQACVDHCHVSGKVRGILCSRCNIGIGMLSDNPETARAAAAYLEK